MNPTLRPVLVFWFSVLTLALLGFAPARLAAADDRKMNVLVIMSDDLRADVGSWGSLAKTPNLDALASKGVAFDRAYCQYPLCNPSRTSLLTGRHPTTTNVYGNRDWFGGLYPDWLSLPKYFKTKGYVTLRTGKVFHGGIDDFTAWTQGGQSHNYGTPQKAAVEQRPAAPAAISDAEENERVTRLVASDVNRASQSDRWEAVEGAAVATQGDTVVANRAIEYLRERKQAGGSEPFFLVTGFSKPHSPLVAPKEFFDLYRDIYIPLPPDFEPRPTVPPGFPAGSIRPNNADLFIRRDATPEAARDMIRAYLACISYMDWNTGRVLAELDQLGLRENTIVVFISDHGYQLGEKGKWSKAGSLWEQGAQIPLIIHDPRAKGNGTRSPRVVQALDLYPTLVELTGLPAAPGLEGRSLVPLLNDPKKIWEHPAYTVWNERNRGITGVVVRTERWRYAEFFGRGAGAMLTDPINDPHEMKNLVNDPRYAGVVKELSGLIAKYSAGKTEPPAP